MLDRRISVKVSSDEAGAISMTPVRTREITLGELLEMIVGVTGKDAERVEAILTRGTFVRSLSRIRWEPFTLKENLAAALGAVPESEPSLPFDANRLRDIVLHTAQQAFVVSPATARKRRLFRSKSFLDALLGNAGQHLAYVRYDYDSHCDCYRIPVEEEWRETRDLVASLADVALRRHLRKSAISEVVLRTVRG